MLEKLLGMMRELEQNDEILDVCARILKKSHKALIKAGFSEDQATQIIAGQGVGIKMSS